MKHVDALSRAPIEDSENPRVMLIETREDEILMFQRSDDEIKRKIDILRKSSAHRSKSEKDSVRDYVLKDGLLYRKIIVDNETRELYVVPRAMRKSIVIRNHDLCSHFGIDKTVSRILNYFYFAGLRRYVKLHIKNCLECILMKNRSGKSVGELHPIPPGNRPFEIVNADHLGPFVTTPRQNKYVLAIIDNLTKYVHIVPVRNVSERITSKKVQDFFERFGAARRIITDRGTCFTAKGFQDMCQKFGVKHTLNSSRHPQANGLVERLNQTLLPSMRCAVSNEEQNDWDTKLKKIERDINSSVCKSTGKTPFEALYGYLPRFEDGELRDLTINREKYTLPTEIQSEVRENIVKAQGKYKLQYDKNKFSNVHYEIGDIVFVKGNSTATGQSTKLQPLFNGPMVIVQKLPSDTYVIKKLNRNNDRGFSTTAHVSQIKIGKGQNITDDSDYESENESVKESVAKPNENNGDRPKRKVVKPKYLDSYDCS